MTTNNIFATPRPQQFSLQYSVLQYVLKNCSAKTLQKLNQSCKYFYSKNRVIVLKNYCNKNSNSCNQIIRQSKNNNFKLWIVSKSDSLNFRSVSFHSRIYRCQVFKIDLSSQSLKYNDFLLLSETLKKCRLNSAKIYYSNGEIVPFEDIMASIPEIYRLSYLEAPFTSFTAQKLSTLNECKNLFDLNLSTIPSIFDIDQFIVFLKKTQFSEGSFKFESPMAEAFIERVGIVDSWAYPLSPYKCFYASKLPQPQIPAD